MIGANDMCSAAFGKVMVYLMLCLLAMELAFTSRVPTASLACHVHLADSF